MLIFSHASRVILILQNISRVLGMWWALYDRIFFQLIGLERDGERETLIKAPIMSSVHVAAWCQSGHRFDLGSNVMARVQGKPCKIWPGRIVTKRDNGYTVLLLGLGETVDIADVTIWVFLSSL